MSKLFILFKKSSEIVKISEDFIYFPVYFLLKSSIEMPFYLAAIRIFSISAEFSCLKCPTVWVSPSVHFTAIA